MLLKDESDYLSKEDYIAYLKHCKNSLRAKFIICKLVEKSPVWLETRIDDLLKESEK